MIVDHAIKHKTPVFVMGNVEELEKLWETLPKQMFTDIFIRPINVVEMVENIKRQMDEYYKMKKRTILAVDDSGVILRNIKTLLEDQYQVIPVNSSEMAIKYLALNIPDLILLDYEMPIVDGRQFMQMIREDTEFQNIPIIFLTGKNDAQTVMDVMSLKPNGYLLKSMDAQKLHAAIDDFFKKCFTGIVVCHVALHDLCSSAVCSNLLFYFFCLLGRAIIIDDNGSSQLRQLRCNGSSDSAGSTGHYCDFSI